MEASNGLFKKQSTEESSTSEAELPKGPRRFDPEEWIKKLESRRVEARAGLEAVQTRELAKKDSDARRCWDKIVRRMGKRYASASLDNYDIYDENQKDALKVFLGYLKNLRENVSQGRCLVLHGAMGTGKDHLMSVALRQAVFEHHMTAEFIFGDDLKLLMRDGVGAKTGEINVLKPLIDADILVVSDALPSKGDLTQYQAETLFHVINKRYVDLKPTWLTLNVKSFDMETEAGQETAGRMGWTAFDRVADGLVAIECLWESHRQREFRRQRGKT